MKMTQQMGDQGEGFLHGGARCNQDGGRDKETSSDYALPVAQQKAKLDTFL